VKSSRTYSRSKDIKSHQVKTNQKGMALVIVLWVLSLMTIMAGSFALSMRREASIVSGVKNNAQAIAIAESGIAIAEMMLLNTDPAKRWRADGNIYQIDAEDSRVRIRILSESGKIDLNAADEKALEALMTHAPINENSKEDPVEHTAKLTGAILDWRDADDLVHINGAEKKEYQDAGLKYQPRNRPFQTVEELQMVMGMDEPTFKWIEPLVTVYSGQQQSALQTASKEVLQVMPGVDQGVVNDYVTARLESARNGLPPPPFPLGSGQNPTAGRGEVFSIDSEAMLDDGSKALISAVIKTSDGTLPIPFQALKWQRNTVSNVSLFTDAMSELLVKQYAEPELNN